MSESINQSGSQSVNQSASQSVYQRGFGVVRYSVPMVAAAGLAALCWTSGSWRW